jgi:hypothetical protein
MPMTHNGLSQRRRSNERSTSTSLACVIMVETLAMEPILCAFSTMAHKFPQGRRLLEIMEGNDAGLFQPGRFARDGAADDAAQFHIDGGQFLQALSINFQALLVVHFPIAAFGAEPDCQEHRFAAGLKGGATL